jgi:hypothetical protein
MDELALSSMSVGTLYEQLSTRGSPSAPDRGRTERTAAIETIDKDRMIVDLYESIGSTISSSQRLGRTEETKSTGETVDKDRASETLTSTLMGPSSDLYHALSNDASAGTGERGETALTASSETVDYDQPPEFSYY